MDDDFKFEPIKGLPEKLPFGEEILWQGNPSWWLMAWNSFGVKWITIYSVLAILYELYSGFIAYAETSAVAIVFFFSILWLGGSSLMTLLAFMQARASIYTITNKRVVLRIGVALPVTFNIPFTQISSVDVRTYGKLGSIALSLAGDNKISYLSCWPHVRPWFFARPAPSMLFIGKLKEVTSILRNSLEDDLAMPKIVKEGQRTDLNNPTINSLGSASVV